MNKKIKILIIDDNFGIRETLSDILAELGYYVDTLDNGYEAVTQVMNNSYDLIVMDINMPGNGIVTLKELKKLKKLYPTIKVILITACCHEERLKEVVNGGAYAVVYKPLDVDKLLKLIEKALGETYSVCI